MRARVLGVEVADELRGIVREPTALFFSVVMPVAFFVLFVSMFGDYSAGGVSEATRMVANFGTFGVLAVTLVTPVSGWRATGKSAGYAPNASPPYRLG